MKCQNCGRELARGSSFCPSCGSKVQKDQFSTASDVTSELRAAFSSSYFLSICILLTISAVLDGVLNFTTLFAVAAWMIYSGARSAAARLSPDGYKFLHTVFKIKYVVVWVAAGITAVSGVVGAILLFVSRQWSVAMLGSAVDYSADLSGVFSDLIALFAKAVTSIPLSLFASLAVFVFAVLCAAVMCAYNKLIMYHLVKYFGGISCAAEQGEKEPVSLDHEGASVRMIVCGVIAALPAVFNMFGMKLQDGHLSFNFHTGEGIGGLCLAAVYFIAFAMIKDHLNRREQRRKTS